MSYILFDFLKIRFLLKFDNYFILMDGAGIFMPKVDHHTFEDSLAVLNKWLTYSRSLRLL